MILSDKEIKAALKNGGIVIDPPPKEDQFTSSALDLRLGDTFYKWKKTNEMSGDHDAPGLENRLLIDPSKIKPEELFQKCLRKLEPDDEDVFKIKPGEFILTSTLERITLGRGSKIAARVEGRSTLARCGLLVHLTAPVIHAGFTGVIVLEMVNHGEHAIKLIPGLSYCQLVFERMGTMYKKGPATKYQGQQGVRRSKKK